MHRPGAALGERVEALAVELRAQLSEHPAAVGLMIGGPRDGPQALSLDEQLLHVLSDAGLDPDDAARACYLLIVPRRSRKRSAVVER